MEIKIIIPDEQWKSHKELFVELDGKERTLRQLLFIAMQQPWNREIKVEQVK